MAFGIRFRWACNAAAKHSEKGCKHFDLDKDLKPNGNSVEFNTLEDVEDFLLKPETVKSLATNWGDKDLFNIAVVEYLDDTDEVGKEICSTEFMEKEAYLITQYSVNYLREHTKSQQ